LREEASGDNKDTESEKKVAERNGHRDGQMEKKRKERLPGRVLVTL